MSDGEDSFLENVQTYEDDLSDIFGLNSDIEVENTKSPSDNAPGIIKQDFASKNPIMVVDLRSKMKKTAFENLDSFDPILNTEIPMPTHSSNNKIPLINQYQNNDTNIHSISQCSSDKLKPVIEIERRLKQLYPYRYFIFKNIKSHYFKLSWEYSYGITPKFNENILKSAFEVCYYFFKTNFSFNELCEFFLHFLIKQSLQIYFSYKFLLYLFVRKS